MVGRVPWPRPGALAVRIGIRSGVGRLGAFEAAFAPGAQGAATTSGTCSRRPATAQGGARSSACSDGPQDRYRSQGARRGAPGLARAWRQLLRDAVPEVTIPLWLVLSGVATVGVARAGREPATSDTRRARTSSLQDDPARLSSFGSFFWDADWPDRARAARPTSAVERFERWAAGSTGRRASGAADAEGLPPGGDPVRGRRLPLPRRRRPGARELDLRSPPAARSRSSASTARARRRWSSCWPACTSPAGRLTVDGTTSPTSTRRVAPPGQRDLPGLRPLRPLGRGQRRVRRVHCPARRRLRAARARGRADAVDALPAGFDTPLSRDVRGRRRPVRRPVAAHRDRARAVRARGGRRPAGARRADGRARRPRGGRASSTGSSSSPRAHDDADLAPLLERAAGRPDRRARRRPGGRGGHARRARRARRALRPAVPAAGRRGSPRLRRGRAGRSVVRGSAALFARLAGGAPARLAAASLDAAALGQRAAGRARARRRPTPPSPGTAPGAVAAASCAARVAAARPRGHSRTSSDFELGDRTAPVSRDLVELAADSPGIEHHERPEYADRLELLRSERQPGSAGGRCRCDGRRRASRS